MSYKKLISGAAALVVAAASMAAVSSADLVVVDKSGVFDSGTGSWMPVLYSDGTFDASTKDVIDYGVDWTQAGSIEVTIRATDPDWVDGGIGGAIVLSSKSEANQTHNWNGKSFWGVEDPELEISTVDDSQDVIFEKVGDYTYKGVAVVDDKNCVYDDAQLVQCAFQYWGNDMSDYEVLEMTIKDNSGAVMMSFDNLGTPSYGDSAAVGGAAAAAEEAAPAVEEAPAEEAAPEPAAEPAAEPAVVTGDVSAAVTTTKASPNTGIEDVAVVAGIAVLAGGALVLTKKRK